jgi:hypothetical protein
MYDMIHDMRYMRYIYDTIYDMICDMTCYDDMVYVI